MFYVLVALIALGVWLYCLFDVLTTDEAEIRGLPKFGWFLVVLLTMNLGAIAWLLFGRPRDARIGPDGRIGLDGRIGREERIGREGRGLEPTGENRFAGPPAPVPPGVDLPRGPDDDPDFLKSLDRRIRGED
ncbi:PLD nuclease N-terminal domain-containing protein [Actinomadura scrupuli]|uniref:PLD nuclease N-terminal domain-containing protein n=1 Tax=Actinomadura scrupuli TaxID=559629 RepID=UPI003D984A87